MNDILPLITPWMKYIPMAKSVESSAPLSWVSAKFLRAGNVRTEYDVYKEGKD